MGMKGVLAMVSPDEFRARTSLRLSSRSGSTLKVDQAYDAYYRDRSEPVRQALHKALYDYLKDHTGFWDNCERDKVSGGLLKWLYEFTAAPGTPVSGLTPEQQLDLRAQTRIRDVEIPHSRFGVLYLLSSIDLQMDTFSAVCEGISVTGGAIGAGLSTDMGKINQRESSLHAFTMDGRNITAQQVTSGASGLVKATPTIVRTSAKVGEKLKTKLMGPTAVNAPATDWSKYFPATLGAFESAASRIPEEYSRSNYVTAGFVAGGLVVAPITLAADLLYNVYQAVKAAMIKLKDMVLERVRAGAFAGDVGALAKAAVKFTVNMVVKEAAPLVGSAMDIGSGLAKTIMAAKDRISSYLDRKQIRIVPGHPEETANTIEGAMTQGILKGLAQMLSGVGKTAVQALLPGLGSLVSAVLSAIEWLVKFIWRYVELRKIKGFLVKVRTVFEAEKARATKKKSDAEIIKRGFTEKVQLRSASTGAPSRSVELTFGDRKVDVPKPQEILEPNLTPGGIITDTARFTELFREGCDASPIVPMLTLNSGLCGSLMTLVRMFDDSGEMISARKGKGEDKKTFDIANQYFERLKQFGSDYLKNSGFQFVAHDPTDNFIAMLMKRVTELRGPATVGGAALAFLAA